MSEERLQERFGSEFMKGHTLFREGESGRDMFIIQSGKVRIAKDTQKKIDGIKQEAKVDISFKRDVLKKKSFI